MRSARRVTIYILKSVQSCNNKTKGVIIKKRVAEGFDRKVHISHVIMVTVGPKAICGWGILREGVPSLSNRVFGSGEGPPPG